ncbi:MAG TPA: DUF3276 family protein [Spirochaetia bacterium]|nr:DUF3276 family protein [Spirochaetia bacterium]
MGQRGEVFSWRIPSASEGRSYFLNLKENRVGDLYLTIVESKKHGETDFERHQVMMFEEDFDELKKGMDRLFSFIGERKNPTPKAAEPAPKPKVRRRFVDRTRSERDQQDS